MTRRTSPGLALLALAVGCESDSLTRQPPETALVTTGAATVLAAGDIAGCQSTYKDDSTAQVIAQYPEATVLAAGDLAYSDGTAANFACYNASWGAFKARTRPAIGNHEMHVIPGVQDTAGQGYYDYWGAQAGERYNGYYAFDLGGWRIYALNSEISHGPTSEQYGWLRDDLNAHPSGCQLAYWHRPSFTSGVNHPGASDFRPIWDLLTEFRAEAVISGHNHNYEVFAPQRSDGTPDANAPRQFVVGTGGSPSTYLFTEPPKPNSLVRATGVWGLLKLDLTPEGAAWEFVSAPGTTFTDTGSLTCDAPGTPPPPNTPPRAFFGSACSRSSCKFTDRSTDTDGNSTIVKWSWAFGDGTSFATTTYESRHPSHTYRAVGTYKPTLTVTDRAGASGTILHYVTLSALNLDPTAVFAPTCSGLACTFEDTSADPDGTIATRAWDYGDGTTGTSPSHTYSTPGTFPITLTVTDNDGGTATASRTVTVQPANALPTAAFEPSCIELACTFTDLSGDTDGTIAGWRWDLGDGVVLTETSPSNPSHDYATAGRYTVELTVTDNGGATHAASQLVTAGNPGPNAAPTAEFTWQCPAEGLTCTFDDEGSADDTRVAEWSWNFGDGGTATSETPSHTFAGGGTYSVSLIVKDNEGVSSTTPAIHDVTVNQAPSAGFSASCTNLSCTFTDQSTDTGGSIASRSWSFGDGTTSTEMNPAKTYAAAGTYTVELTVTDNGTATATASKTITVNAPVLNSAPKAFFGSSCTRLACKFTDRSTDADGNSTIVRWSWTYGDGKTFTTTNPAARSPSYTYAAGGTYKPRLTVTDNKGATGSILHSITVTP